MNWCITLNDKTIEKGSLPLTLAPQATQTLTLLEALPTVDRAGELWLNVEVVQPKATAWSEANHRCAWDQWQLPAPLHLPEAPCPG